MDVFSKKKRSWIMGRIRSKNTKPEIIVRSILHRMGYRFSLLKSGLPGSPDIVLKKYRTAVFIHGCFWHRHKGCRVATMPKTRVGFWKRKFERNVERDRLNICELRRLGWKTITVWECQVLRDPAKLAEKLSKKLGALPSSSRPPSVRRPASSIRHRSLYDLPDRREFLKIAEKRADYNK